LIIAIDTDLDWVRKHSRFGLRAAQWEASLRDNGFLLHGTELREAIRWLEQAATIKSRQPTDAQEQYILASEKWEAGEIRRLSDLNNEKERQRKEAERQVRIATARELASYAWGNLDEDPERSLLLAMHAVAATRSHDDEVIPAAEDIVHRALFESRVRLTMKGHESGVWSVAWRPDGQRLATASSDNTVKVWESQTGRELLTIKGHENSVSCVAWSPDGQRLATASYDNTIRIWEAETGQELLTMKGPAGFGSLRSLEAGWATAGDGEFG
jgi:WD40 repeat protein